MEKDYANERGVGYYAPNPEEVAFDNWIRKNVMDDGSKAEMALYVQGQEILSQLRRLRDQLTKETLE